MLKTVWLTEKSDIKGGCAMLLGGFDGLHIGHRRLLSYAKNSGLSVGLMTIVGGKTDGNIFTFAERERIFKDSGADFVFELPFEEIKDLSPQEFLQKLAQEFTPKLFVCGEDFRFGKGALGTPESIKQGTRVRVEVLPLVEKEGEKVSSRAIKSLLEQGNVEKANALLGEEFFLVGKVEKDRQVGRTIGFPTANVRYPKEKFPLKRGVYESYAVVDGKKYKGITNFGARPTFENAVEWTETYLDGFQGDLYGQNLQIRFVRYLRDIEKFESIESLKNQLQKDIHHVRTRE